MTIQEVIDKLEQSKEYFGPNAEVTIEIDSEYDTGYCYTSIDSIYVFGQNELCISGKQ